jgi:DNA polymerase-3 subunit delta
MVVYQFRTMLKIADLFDKKMSSSQIASKAKIHPFVVSKTLPLLRNFTLDKLKKNYQKIAKLDYEMKSGKGDAESALPLLVFDFCAN